MSASLYKQLWERRLKITVYFEAPAGAHEIAVFYDEMLYMACVPALETKAKAQGYVLSESVAYEDEDPKQIEIDNLRAELEYFYEGRK
jgi:hypothetical protein